MSATATQEQAERSELQAILNSGIFNRSPSLAAFLRFVCERYFDGNTDGLKEYCIAIEALKRPPDFDQKKDAIVRVEAYRLRRRLAEYYRQAGADHTIQIEIPTGQYAPRFVYQAGRSAFQVEDVVSLNTAPGPVREWPPVEERELPHINHYRSKTAWISLVALAIIALASFLLFRTNKTFREVWPATSSGRVPMDFRMLAGYKGLPFTDRQGRRWSPDAYYDGGVSVSLPDHRSFQGVPDRDFAATQRVGDFEYSIPVNEGIYEVHLHFLEGAQDDVEAAGPKLFNVFVNGKLALDHIDPLSDAGATKRLTSRVLCDIRPARDGHIHLKFQQQGTKPELVGLEILTTTAGHMRPLRIVAGAHSVIDMEGSTWLADECFLGGTLVDRKDVVEDSSLKNLYKGERYGNFAYHIPLPRGRYRLKLYFAEAYFTNQAPQARIFNVFADGATLLRNFNVMREAGGPRHAITKTFENLEPNAQGKIVLEFVPVVNYAEINAIEVTQMN